ncbi:TPA: hypothetical protein JD344_13445 [Serratia marcescens]|uniref:Uncharacterized protein n=1 Tax=Serratia marcescens TaxID=615 RepID=A0AB33FKV0_SERMA|nr:hypothetical protein DKC05_03450 [Serratia marcescens]PYA61831.1 hypothetical protein DMW53_08240 [Serratia marcescens]PYB20461.1 hypothetical protein DMW55_05950 [Serratia marcescens]QFH62664.1 hypothetical protein FR888_11030 [Serratia marcescens]TWY28504.1 hypothetical protein FR965_16615 [Serratia marcescens]
MTFKRLKTTQHALTSVWTTKLTLTKSKIALVIENGAHCAPFFFACLSPGLSSSAGKKRGSAR